MSDILICSRCRVPMFIEDGNDATEVCHNCAHSLLAAAQGEVEQLKKNCLQIYDAGQAELAALREEVRLSHNEIAALREDRDNLVAALKRIEGNGNTWNFAADVAHDALATRKEVK